MEIPHIGLRLTNHPLDKVHDSKFDPLLIFFTTDWRLLLLRLLSFLPPSSGCGIVQQSLHYCVRLPQIPSVQ